MTRFTESPYEYMMTQKPYAGKEADSGPVAQLPESRCVSCPYGKGKPCIGVCIQKLLSETTDQRKGGARLWQS